LHGLLLPGSQRDKFLELIKNDMGIEETMKQIPHHIELYQQMFKKCPLKGGTKNGMLTLCPESLKNQLNYNLV